MQLITKIPDKERLIVGQLHDFVENEKDYPIALIAGMRHVGKSTVLKQMQKYYPTAPILDFSGDLDEARENLAKFAGNPSSPVLLIDEITWLPGYENICQNLYNIAGGQSEWKFKAIITGSSPAHICSLANNKLGGGRSVLFYLPVITFVEYLYFTGKIPSCRDYADAKPEHFKDYLQLRDLPAGMTLTFDERYFVNYYDINSHSNICSASSRAQNDLQKEDLRNLANFLAYQLADSPAYDTVIRPKIAEEELQNELLPSEIRALDFSGTFIAESSRAAKGLSFEDHARLIEFLLASRIANVETTLLDAAAKPHSEFEVVQMLRATNNRKNLQDFFKKVSIAIGNPLLYTRLGNDILAVVGMTMDDLWKNSDNNALLGKMLEVYIRGAMAQLENPLLAFSSMKLNYNGEVDIYKPNAHTSILCEVTAKRRPKSLDKINLLNYFPDEPMIRICCTESHKDDIYGFHRIPYAQLCCMIDTGDIFKLQKSTIDDVNRPLSGG